MKKQATKIKICGLTKEKEADYLNQIHADFAGMVVFFSKSKRNISLDHAKKIKSGLLPEIKKVAVTALQRPALTLFKFMVILPILI